MNHHLRVRFPSSTQCRNAFGQKGGSGARRFEALKTARILEERQVGVLTGCNPEDLRSRSSILYSSTNEVASLQGGATIFGPGVGPVL